MDKISKRTYRDILWRVALAVFVLCLIEGGFYYHYKEEDVFLRILSIIQNAIKAYKIDPDIKPAAAMAFAKEYPDSMWITIVSYMYCVSVVVAPFCTVAALTMLIRTPFSYLKGRKGRKGEESILVLGSGSHREAYIKCLPGQGCRVYAVENGPVSMEKKEKFLERGVSLFVHYDGLPLSKTLRKAHAERMDNILLCDEDPLRNLALLKMISEEYKNIVEKSGPKEGFRQKIYLLCDDVAIADIARAYYTDFFTEPTESTDSIETTESTDTTEPTESTGNTETTDSTETTESTDTTEPKAPKMAGMQYELYVEDTKQKAVNEMLKDHPFTEYFDRTKYKAAEKIVNEELANVEPKKRPKGEKRENLIREKMKQIPLSYDALNVHLGIIGFGEYGQKTLLQSLSKAVLSDQSTILMDVFDKNMKNIIGSFMKNLSTYALDRLNVTTEDGITCYELCIRDEGPEAKYNTDGITCLRFWDVDTDTLSFTKLFHRCRNLYETDYPYTYLVVAMDTDKRMAAALMEMKRLMDAADQEVKPTIVVRTRSEEQAYSLIDIEDNEIHPFLENRKMYSFAALKNSDVLNLAKKFHWQYNQVSDIIGKEAEENGNAEKYFLELLEDPKASLRRAKECLNQKDNTESIETKWKETSFYDRASSTAQSFHQAEKKWLMEQSFAKELTKKVKSRLEHRRWNLYMISRGYCYGDVEKKKRLSLRKHGCIVTFDVLMKKKPGTLEYDYTPYAMMEAEKDIQKGK